MSEQHLRALAVHLAQTGPIPLARTAPARLSRAHQARVSRPARDSTESVLLAAATTTAPPPPIHRQYPPVFPPARRRFSRRTTDDPWWVRREHQPVSMAEQLRVLGKAKQAPGLGRMWRATVAAEQRMLITQAIEGVVPARPAQRDVASASRMASSCRGGDASLHLERVAASYGTRTSAISILAVQRHFSLP